MRWASWRNSAVLTGVFMAGILTGVGMTPLWRIGVSAFYAEEFGRLTYLCDSAMREHLIAKQSLAISPSEDGVRTLKEAELGLLDCQDYDMLRKHLGTLGLSDNELSMLSLKAIEERAGTLQQVVQTHEIRY